MQNFKCNTCNKIIKLDNVYTRCMLTKNCTGKLSKTSDIDNNIPEFKKQVFTFEQKIPLSIWRIKHPLNGNPSLMVYDTNGVQLFDFSINYVDAFNIFIEFNDVKMGSVQLMLNNASQNTIIQKPLVEYSKISKNGFISIAIHSHDKNTIPKLLMNDQYTIINFSIDSSNENSWNDKSTINMFGNNYKVYTLFLLNDIDTNRPHSFKYPTMHDISELMRYNTIEYSDDLCYILLSSEMNPEYRPFDDLYTLEKYNKIYDNIINMKDLQFSNNYLDGGELYVSSEIIKPQYPNIIIPNV